MTTIIFTSLSLVLYTPWKQVSICTDVKGALPLAWILEGLQSLLLCSTEPNRKKLHKVRTLHFLWKYTFFTLFFLFCLSGTVWAWCIYGSNGDSSGEINGQPVTFCNNTCIPYGTLKYCSLFRWRVLIVPCIRTVRNSQVFVDQWHCSTIFLVRG